MPCRQAVWLANGQLWSIGIFVRLPILGYNSSPGNEENQGEEDLVRQPKARWALILAGLALLWGLVPGPPARAGGERLVLAFYYSWYDQNTWTSGQVPDVPAQPYSSSRREAIARHVDQAQGAGIDALVLNWWGQGNQTEKNLRTLLDVAAGRGFRVAVDFDLNSPFMSGVGGYAQNLRHLHDVHAVHPAYLRYEGRPVVFFYNVSRLPVSTWRNLRDQVDPAHQALWIAEGTDLAYQSVFDGHHLYSITWPNRIPPARTLASWGDRVRKYNRQHDTAKLWVATVMPGYDDRQARPGSGFARSRDGGDYYRGTWQAAIASQPNWIVVNSFNEWPEGTYIEPSRAYGRLYLDLTREWSARFKAASSASDAAVAAQPAATATPPKPRPTPTPTPEPQPTLLPAFQAPAGSGALPPATAGDGWNYLLAQDSTGRFWLVSVCPLYPPPGGQPFPIY
jgi:hypothetical protein